MHAKFMERCAHCVIALAVRTLSNAAPESGDAASSSDTPVPEGGAASVDETTIGFTDCSVIADACTGLKAAGVLPVLSAAQSGTEDTLLDTQHASGRRFTFNRSVHEHVCSYICFTCVHVCMRWTVHA